MLGWHSRFHERGPAPPAPAPSPAPPVPSDEKAPAARFTKGEKVIITNLTDAEHEHSRFLNGKTGKVFFKPGDKPGCVNVHLDAKVNVPAGSKRRSDPESIYKTLENLSVDNLEPVQI